MKYKLIDCVTGETITKETINDIIKQNTNVGNIEIQDFYVSSEGELSIIDTNDKVTHIGSLKEIKALCMTENEYPDLEYIEADFVSNVYNIRLGQHKDIFTNNNVKFVEMFPQTWETTAGGFEEPNKLAVKKKTTTYTSVFRYTDKDDNEYYGVYFGNEFAYIIENVNEEFYKDLSGHCLKSVYDAGLFY